MLAIKITCAVIVVCVVFGLVLCLVSSLRSPFRYPYFEYTFDVTGKRKPDAWSLLDEFLIHGGFERVKAHMELLDAWHADCEDRIDSSLLMRYREKQYLAAVDDKGAFVFYLARTQTRYEQRNYIRLPYKVSVVVQRDAYDFETIADRYAQLEAINFECTLRDYHTRNQRKLMTRELREQIMVRDNYTCKICGKHMPDEVGLQIDHIVPVARGGKTVPSNLQVLCSKCNGRKGTK